ncbi:hypothetical protein BGZ60DRAFT_420744 [Tricladium varicosporioides]|nr:hypothetical protein BGZ60DRAFT_420744 [Hymenoscyphus varicosporioides]
MLKTEESQGREKERRTRQRTSTSCTECKRRKQKCNQAKDRPCNNCARRFPPVECKYTEPKPKKQRSNLERLVELNHDQLNSSGSGAGYRGVGVVESRIPTKSRSGSADISKPSIKKEKGTESDISHIFQIDASFIHDPSVEALRSWPNSGVSNVQVGNDQIAPLVSLPIEATRRNAELFHFFLQRLSPFMSSLDGTSAVPEFNKYWIPFMIQSPLLVYISVLTSSYFQAMARKVDVETSVDAMTARVKLITLINEHITTHSKGVDDEAIGAVMSLAYNELVYADCRSVIAHLNGLREMVRSRGGLENITFKILRIMMMRTDFQVACTFESEPIVHGPQEPAFAIETEHVEFESPFLPTKSRFIDFADGLNISAGTATILDDMRFITNSILSLSKSGDPEKARLKFRATVQWIHDRLSSSEAETHDQSDFVYQTCRATAVLYTSVILARKPISVAGAGSLLMKVWMTMWRVPLSRWKNIPAIFFWVLLVINPITRDRPEGRFVKGMFAAATMAIALIEWDTAAAILKNFMTVQRWLGGSDVAYTLSKSVALPPAAPAPTPARED